jgi:hypothetical protein
MEDSLGIRVRRRARERRRPPAEVSRQAQQCPGCHGGLHLPDGWLFALLVPELPQRPCSLLMLPDSAAGISDALGGALLDECAVDGLPTHRCWLYLDVTRRDRRLPRNQRLERLATALGWPRDQAGDWLGPALITGRDLHWADLDVPSIVVAASLPTS